jgi:hypothetical protein
MSNGDTLDKTIAFLQKREGIDKVGNLGFSMITVSNSSHLQLLLLLCADIKDSEVCIPADSGHKPTRK